MRNWNEPPPERSIPQPQSAIVVNQESPEKIEAKSKAEQYKELREKQKTQFLEKQKTKNQDNLGGMGMPDTFNNEGNQDQDGDLDALEKMNLDNRIDDSNMFDQFNPMGGGFNAPGLELQAQSNKINKKNTYKLGQEEQKQSPQKQ